MKTEIKTGTDLYNDLLTKFEKHFQSGMPSFGNVLWQLFVNDAWDHCKPHCFVSNYDNNGLVLGIAEHSESGYHNTHVYFNDGITYDQAEDVLEQINEEAFGLLPRACMEIVLTSMRVN